VVERSLLLAEHDVVAPEDLPPNVRANLSLTRGPLGLEFPESGIDLEAVEKSLVLKALEKAQGNVTRAARLLGLTRRTLQYRLEKIQGGGDSATQRKNAETI
jgi:DNA-binding NtrC family response regulator